MRTIPLERKEAAEFVNRLHRHHDPVMRDRFRIGAEHNGEAGVIGPEYLYFWGDGRRNHFTTAYHGGKKWCEG